MRRSFSCPINDNNPQILLDYVSRRATVEERAYVEHHAVNCQPCQTFIAEQAEVWSALDELTAPPVSREFDKKLYARIANQDQQSWWVRMWRRLFESGEPGSWRPAAVMSAAFAVIIAVILVRVPEAKVDGPTHKPGIEQTVAIHDNDVESVELMLEDLEMLKVVGPAQSTI